MKKEIKVLQAITLLMVILISSPVFSQTKMESKKTTEMENATSVHSNMRQLWSEHVIWTRNVIFCLVDDLPGTDQAMKRLNQNQTDIGNAIKPYYGATAGTKLADLLANHNKLTVDMVKAAKASNDNALADANKQWYSNSDEIATFLSSANPNLKFESVKDMMDEHLKLVTNQTMQRINKNYEADVDAFDKVYSEILQMSDMLSEGISKQFPSKTKTANK